jgi:HK97 family phage major capsid protein
MNKEQILAKIREIMAKQQTIVDLAKTENRAMNDAERKDFDAHQAEIENLQKDLERAEKLDANNKFLDAPANPPVIPAVLDVQKPKLDDGGFANLGEFLNAVKFGDKKGRLQNLASSDVGILIPAQFSQDILQLSPEQEIVMPRATNIPAGSPPDAEFTIPYFQQGADGAMGGVELTWTAEAKTVSDTKDPVIKDLTLRPQEVSGMSTINNKTLMNWQASGAFVQNLLRQAWISGRDYKFLRGSGAGCPFGVYNAPGAIKIARATSATVGYVDLVNMLARLLPEALSNAVWVANMTVMPKIMTLQDEAKQYIFNSGDATKGVGATLLGRPILWNGKTPTVGNEGDIMLVDFKYYLTKAGSGPFVAVSEHVKFTTNQTVFKIVANIDGQPWVKDPLLLEDGETTVSPYVILK